MCCQSSKAKGFTASCCLSGLFPSNRNCKAEASQGARGDSVLQGWIFCVLAIIFGDTIGHTFIIPQFCSKRIRIELPKTWGEIHDEVSTALSVVWNSKRNRVLTLNRKKFPPTASLRNWHKLNFTYLKCPTWYISIYVWALKPSHCCDDECIRGPSKFPCALFYCSQLHPICHLYIAINSEFISSHK